jgi:uncharacterized protein (DUF2147 family)
MKAPLLNLITIGALLSIVTPSSTAAQEAGIVGVWSTGSQGGQVEIYRCGPSLCGKVIAAAVLRTNPDQRDVNNPDRKLRQRPLMNLVVLRNFKGGPRTWTGGAVYDPESGDGADRGYLELRTDGALEVKGCKAAIFCRTKIWKRVN